MKKSLFLALTVAFLLGCNQASTKSAEQRVQDPTLVAPSSELLAQLKLAEVGRAAVAETLRVAGRIDFDEQRLARLNSSELSSQQLAYLKARAQLELNRRNAERAKSLFEADVIGAAELQRRESEFQISLAETRAAADQLLLLGVSRAAIDRLAKHGAVDSVTPVVATMNGVVVERKLAQGQVVQPADALFVVADLSRLWAVAQVPEQQVSQVKTGQSVRIEVPALGHEKLIGKLIFVGQTIDPETRTVLVRTELDNRDGRLKPAMLASMLIEAKPVDRLVVPASAVVRQNDEDHVFVAEGDGIFRLVKVKLGPEQGGVRAALSGLKGGEKLVVDGAFHLNNERNRKEMEGS